MQSEATYGEQEDTATTNEEGKRWWWTVSHLLSELSLMFVTRVHSSDVRHGKDGLNCILVIRNRTRDASVDAEDIVIDHSRERKAIKALVDLFPNTLS
jgi:hypothetical protein